MEKFQPERSGQPSSKSVNSGLGRVFHRVFAAPTMPELIDPKEIFKDGLTKLSIVIKISNLLLIVIFFILSLFNNKSVDGTFIHDFNLIYFDNFVKCKHKHDYLITISGNFGLRIGFLFSLALAIVTFYYFLNIYKYQLRYIYIRFFYNKSIFKFFFSTNFLKYVISIFILIACFLFLLFLFPELYQFFCEKFVRPDYGIFSFPILGIYYYYSIVIFPVLLLLISSYLLVFILFFYYKMSI